MKTFPVSLLSLVALVCAASVSASAATIAIDVNGNGSIDSARVPSPFPDPCSKIRARVVRPRF